MPPIDRTPIDRRAALRTGAGLVLGAGLSRAAAPVLPPARAQPAPGALTVAILRPTTLDPQRAAFTQDLGVARLLFRGLVATNADGQPIPALAAELPTQENGGLADDGRALTLRLAHGLRWSDGAPLTADDVVYGILRLLHPRLAGPYASFAFAVEGAEAYHRAAGVGADDLARLQDAVGVRALDDLTVAIRLSRPQPTALHVLALPGLAPVKRQAIEAAGGVANDRWAAAGTLAASGPFTLTAQSRDHLVLERNPAADPATVPLLHRVELRFVEDSGGLLSAFREERLDIAPLAGPLVAEADADPALAPLLRRSPAAATQALHFQHGHTLFADPRVRYALARSIDREAYVRAVVPGEATPARSWLPPGTPGYDPSADDGLDFDPGQARLLMAAAGLAGGRGAPPLRLLAVTGRVGEASARFLTAAWREHLGLTVAPDLVDTAELAARRATGRFDLTVTGWQQDYPDPENWLPHLFGAGGSANFSGYANPAFDELLRQAAGERDGSRRIDLYREAHRLLLHDVAIVPLYHPARVALVAPRVRGLTPNIQDLAFMGDFALAGVEAGAV